MPKAAFRVTPQLALYAYAKTGLKAAAGCYIDGSADSVTCGCPAGILAVAAGVNPDELRRVCTWLQRRAGLAYEVAFTETFDAAGGTPKHRSNLLLDRERQKQGEEDGRRVRIAVENAGLFRCRYLPWQGNCNREEWLHANRPTEFAP